MMSALMPARSSVPRPLPSLCAPPLRPCAFKMAACRASLDLAVKRVLCWSFTLVVFAPQQF